jgi:putative alpha-1,2-mannosidase
MPAYCPAGTPILQETRMNRFKNSAMAGLACAWMLPPVQADDPIKFIDPMIGATSEKSPTCGRTFPGAATPFGMLQVSPDTFTGLDNAAGFCV